MFSEDFTLPSPFKFLNKMRLKDRGSLSFLPLLTLYSLILIHILKIMLIIIYSSFLYVKTSKTTAKQHTIQTNCTRGNTKCYHHLLLNKCSWNTNWVETLCMALGGIAEQDTKLDKTQGPECSYGGEALEPLLLLARIQYSMK